MRTQDFMDLYGATSILIREGKPKGGIALKLAVWINTVKPIAATVDESLQPLVQKYGAKDEGGKLVQGRYGVLFEPDGASEVNELFNTQIEIPEFPKFESGELDDIQLESTDVWLVLQPYLTNVQL